MDEVKENKFERFQFKQRGYSMSKLAVLAHSKILANKYKGKFVVCSYCPGLCYTTLSHGKGVRSAMNGAKGIELLCNLDEKELMNNDGAVWGIQENENYDIDSARLCQLAGLQMKV